MAHLTILFVSLQFSRSDEGNFSFYINWVDRPQLVVKIQRLFFYFLYVFLAIYVYTPNSQWLDHLIQTHLALLHIVSDECCAACVQDSQYCVRVR